MITVKRTQVDTFTMPGKIDIIPVESFFDDVTDEEMYSFSVEIQGFQELLIKAGYSLTEITDIIRGDVLDKNRPVKMELPEGFKVDYPLSYINRQIEEYEECGYTTDEDGNALEVDAPGGLLDTLLGM